MSAKTKILLTVSVVVISIFTITACDRQSDGLSGNAEGQRANKPQQDIVSELESKNVRANKPAENELFVTIISVTSPVSPGGTPTTVFVKTKPGAVCNIKAGYKGGSNEEKALTEKVADANGLVSWSWTVDPSVSLGTYPITVTATDPAGSGKIVTVQENIEVKTAEECKK
ncbi:MAG: hypothetical protein K6T91_04210 [Firmicutes bacterium]|nr:hypothetical protein [Bacillota bacterium]